MNQQQQAVVDLMHKVRKTMGVEYIVIVYGNGMQHTLQGIGIDRHMTVGVLRQQADEIASGRGEFGPQVGTPSPEAEVRPPAELPGGSAASRAIAFLRGGS